MQRHEAVRETLLNVDHLVPRVVASEFARERHHGLGETRFASLVYQAVRELDAGTHGRGPSPRGHLLDDDPVEKEPPLLTPSAHGQETRVDGAQVGCPARGRGLGHAGKSEVEELETLQRGPKCFVVAHWLPFSVARCYVHAEDGGCQCSPKHLLCSAHLLRVRRGEDDEQALLARVGRGRALTRAGQELVRERIAHHAQACGERIRRTASGSVSAIDDEHSTCGHARCTLSRGEPTRLVPWDDDLCPLQRGEVQAVQVGKPTGAIPAAEDD
mmetsp:Transcript_2770/g.8234  ORF Transcript_2770/g.8234 Transcript_2770/m.8234 type:complete len:272 (-) Transcript_2770:304-1119(-)